MRNHHCLSAKTAITAVAAFLAMTLTAGAALSPYWQSAREIDTIVNDQRVHDALAGEEAILSISATGADVYEVRTQRCQLSVTVVDKPTDTPVMGPRQFDLEICTAECS